MCCKKSAGGARKRFCVFQQSFSGHTGIGEGAKDGIEGYHCLRIERCQAKTFAFPAAAEHI